MPKTKVDFSQPIQADVIGPHTIEDLHHVMEVELHCMIHYMCAVGSKHTQSHLIHKYLQVGCWFADISEIRNKVDPRAEIKPLLTGSAVCVGFYGANATIFRPLCSAVVIRCCISGGIRQYHQEFCFGKVVSTCVREGVRGRSQHWEAVSTKAL